MAGRGAMQLGQWRKRNNRIGVRNAGALFDPREMGNSSDVKTKDKYGNKGAGSNVCCRVRDITVARSPEDSNIADGIAKARSDRRVGN